MHERIHVVTRACKETDDIPTYFRGSMLYCKLGLIYGSV